MRHHFTLIPLSTPADYEVFKGLLEEYAGRDLDDSAHSTIWQDIAQLPGRYAPPLGGALLATFEGELAGCGAFTATAHEGIAEIKRVYVRENFRRQGLARVLTEALLKQAQQAGYQTAGVCTWAHNILALSLYQSLGFSPISSFREAAKDHLVFLGLPLEQTNPNPNTNLTS